MKFYPLASAAGDPGELESEYRSAREIGRVRLGELRLYCRAGMKHYYIPYREVRRCFRRVELIPAKMCCGKGDFEVENLVICGDAGELIQVQLPGSKAAKILLEELKLRIPEA
ncbi:MAG: hypothetical protein IKD79_02930, partial [Oscillospiraceae bacterium]|nr:hypothetical protein [Oscillospiraceae bacterium]